MKKALTALLALACMLCLFGCSEATPVPTETTQPPVEPTGPLIGICLPEENEFWKTRAGELEQALQSLGYQTQVAYGGKDPETQAQQIGEFVEAQAGGLIVTAVDSAGLHKALEKAQEAGIPVVAYDRPLMEDATVDALVSFDYQDMGRRVGEYIVTAKKLDTAQNEQRSYNIEFFMGSVEDRGAYLFHEGLLEVLQPYLDAKVLKCPSGRTLFADNYVMMADPEEASRKIEAALENFYTKQSLDIVCFGTDEMAAGCQETISAYSGEWDFSPLVTGVGGTLSGVKKIAEGYQKVTLYQDYHEAAQICAQTIQKLESGAGLTTELMTDNYVIQVPTILGNAQVVDSGNYRQLLIDTGIYSQEELN